MLLRSLGLLGILATTQAKESFHESLTLTPLPDGKLSVSFDFTTEFDASAGYDNLLTPPSLLLPLADNHVSELAISFVAGKWDQLRSGQIGPTQTEAGGGGGEIRGWLNDGEDISRRWTTITQALGGLFCAGLGPEDEEPAKTFGHIYPPRGPPDGLTHRLLSTPYLPLCTENLTPFLSLLPSKGHSGLSSLLAQPGTVFSWGFKTEGIEVIMPTSGQPGMWRGWWEGVVDLVPEKGGSRAFSLGSLFKKGVPRVFPEASSSILRLIQPNAPLESSVDPDSTAVEWIDGKLREIMQWDLLDERVHHKDIRIYWPGEGHYQYRKPSCLTAVETNMPQTTPEYASRVSAITFTSNRPPIHVTSHSDKFHLQPGICRIDSSDLSLSPQLRTVSVMIARTIEPPPIVVHRTVTSPRAMDGIFTITIRNNANVDREAIYSEIWPWWVKGWISEMQVRIDGQVRADALDGISYHPSAPPKPTTTAIHLSLKLPAHSELVLTIPFTKLMLKYTEHRPDAERGRELSSGVLTLLDLVDTNSTDPTPDNLRFGRARIYTPKLLLDIPTPDFSMPYNVIIMSSTVMAVFFGLMHGSLTRRWGWIQLPDTAPVAEVEKND